MQERIDQKNLKHIKCDDVIIEDDGYFCSLKNNALLIFTPHNQTDLLIDQISRQLEDVHITDESKDRSYDRLSKIVWDNPRFLEMIKKRREEHGSKKECYTEDPKWFKGIDDETNDGTTEETQPNQNKSEVMKNMAKSKITDYFKERANDYILKELEKPKKAKPNKKLSEEKRKVEENLRVENAKDYLFKAFEVPKEPKKPKKLKGKKEKVGLKEEPKSAELIRKQQVAISIIEEWEAKLKEADYYSHYFSKADHAKGAFCDEKGWFECEGDYKPKIGCTYNQTMKCGEDFHLGHWINPYLSREARILFSTWDLDHRIEKERTVLPKLVELIEAGKDEDSINVDYFYDLLFTRENIRLVHIVCHNQKERKDMELDEDKVLL
ncbi:gelsolin-related protein of 125 kDa-like [Watersipora subatra]|uniref:gelsolin-related protein of 125 kDa-like n=1 Tax=Watersipora subatra TaxID=2589382 RepID=UPI00355C8638